MSLLIRIAFLGTLFFVLTEKVLAVPVLDAEELEALLNSEDSGEGDENQAYIPPYLWKRGSFWASHPSDFNPMRRPTSGNQSGGRGSKKSESNPYHPIPRSVNISQKNQRSQEGANASTNEELENLIEGLREKRQSIGSYLLMKLGRKPAKSAGGSDVTRRLGRRRT